ncbi:hypothetical protein Ahy_A07g035671 [Arachis hypogaea]|uniref:Ubiquitin-like protease family profile domain-containing protein n=1 Tax=Arachis hypogaea TaxID=3818 RepID=A0A445CE98_ARAHY|nr:hypothetical protein Ahy_A07g035671 [Arachis hypogaea]
MCMILNDKKCCQFEEEIYCVPTDIMNIMLGLYGEKYIYPKTNMAYRINHYTDFLPFLDRRKLVSHLFKKAFYVLDPVKKKKTKIPQSRITLNKFVGLIVSQMRVYAGAKPLIEDGEGVEAQYISISGQRTSYDCEIYVMKWLEIIEPENIKKGEKKLIPSASEAIRLPKPSAALSNPFCKFTYGDIDKTPKHFDITKKSSSLYSWPRLRELSDLELLGFIELVI